MGAQKRLNRKMSNLEKDKQKEYEARKELMLVDLKEITQKYKIDLIPVIRVVESGIHPLIAFADVTKEYEEAAAVEEAKKKAAKPKLEV